jgi:hypothetical protein
MAHSEGTGERWPDLLGITDSGIRRPASGVRQGCTRIGLPERRGCVHQG